MSELRAIDDTKRLCVNMLHSSFSIQGKEGYNMTPDDVTQIIRSGLYTIIISAAPPLLTSLVVGLTISIFQTVTSIQEQTLTFVPKILSIFAILMLAGHWIINNVIVYTKDLWSDFTLYIK